MVQYRILNDSTPLNPRGKANTCASKPMSCYDCREPNVTFVVFDLMTPDDVTVDKIAIASRYAFRNRTDACEPMMQATYNDAEQRRNAAQATQDFFTGNTELLYRLGPPATRPQRANYKRLPVIGAAAEKLHDRFIYRREPCEVQYLGRCEGTIFIDAQGHRYERPAPPQPAQAQPVVDADAIAQAVLAQMIAAQHAAQAQGGTQPQRRRNP